MAELTPAPPVAKKVPVTRERFGDTATDEYAWMRDRDDADLLPLLEAENAHTDAVLDPVVALREQVFGEIKDRTQETDLSVPYRKGAWWYYSRTVEGLPYGIHCRRPATPGDERPPGDDPGATEQVLLDENALAEGHDYLALGVGDVSPDGNLLAYSVDTSGDEEFTLHVKDLRTGRLLPERIEGTSYGFAWAADSRTCFYTTLDAAQRPHRVHRHVLGQDPPDGSADHLLLEEGDERFFVGVGSSRSEELVVVSLDSKVTSEVHLVPASSPLDEPRVVVPRRQGVEYSIAHHGDHLYVLANHDPATDAPAENFGLWRAPLADPSPANWRPVVAPSATERLEAAEAFAGHLVLHLRRDGGTAVRVQDLATGAWRDLTFDEAVHTVGPGVNEEFATTAYRFGYQSLVTPGTVYSEDLSTGERTLLKQQPVLGGYDPDVYVSTRLWATADDGTRVPVSAVRRRDVPLDGSAPCVLYGYGSYEASMDPWFSVARLSLLDRGVVFAIAHVRGGGEMGRAWYEQGKLTAKATTFGDFVACARHLVETGWTSPARLAARGGSAGGLLMGAVANLAPELFRAVVAEVPFVDALNTILDPSLPLTVIEWEEWGNPIDSSEVFAAMRSYTPYENIRPVEYPAIYATGGLNDPRVGYHEPAKWVQRLREVTTNGPDRPILLRMDLGAGHGGPSGRYDAWRHEAEILAFLLWQLGISDPRPGEARP